MSARPIKENEIHYIPGTEKEMLKQVKELLDSKDAIIRTLRGELQAEKGAFQLAFEDIGKLEKQLKEKELRIKELENEGGSLKADEVTLAFFRKYLNEPNGNLETLCRKAQELRSLCARMGKALHRVGEYIKQAREDKDYKVQFTLNGDTVQMVDEALAEVEKVEKEK